MRFLYELAFTFFALFYLPRFFLTGKFGRSAGSRFGSLSEEQKRLLSERPVIWFHAVSVGEIGLALGFIDRLRDELQGARVLITTTTITGHEVAQKLKAEEDVLLYVPVDFRWAVRRFLRQVSLQALVLFETEIWPNLIWELASKKIPVLIVNGRISDKAFARYLRVRFLLKKILPKISLIGAQDERMRERFIALGADKARTLITGNMKFDWTPPQRSQASTENLRRVCRRTQEFLWVAGSTHEGEETLMFETYRTLKKEHPQLRLLIAPRHLQRLGQIEKEAQKFGLVTVRISEKTSGADSQGGEVWLLDQMGALAALYSMADAVFVGGSLVPAGGHNLVEPAYFEKPIFFGPFMNNFQEMAAEFKRQGGAIEVPDTAGLREALTRLLEEPARGRALGQAARRLVGHHQGATEKSKELLLSRWQLQKERKLVSV